MREREREKGGEREKHRFVDLLIHAFANCFLYVPWPGTEPATLVYQINALTHWAMWPGSSPHPLANRTMFDFGAAPGNKWFTRGVSKLGQWVPQFLLCLAAQVTEFTWRGCEKVFLPLKGTETIDLPPPFTTWTWRGSRELPHSFCVTIMESQCHGTEVWINSNDILPFNTFLYEKNISMWVCYSVRLFVI